IRAKHAADIHAGHKHAGGRAAFLPPCAGHPVIPISAVHHADSVALLDEFHVPVAQALAVNDYGPPLSRLNRARRDGLTCDLVPSSRFDRLTHGVYGRSFGLPMTHQPPNTRRPSNETSCSGGDHERRDDQVFGFHSVFPSYVAINSAVTDWAVARHAD